MKTIAVAAIMTTFISINLYAWGAPDLLAADQRSKAYKVDTQLDKKKAFQKIVIWSAKTFANANEAIKLQGS